MATRIWRGGFGDWSDPTRWIEAGSGAQGAPEPGDAATIASGDAWIVGPQGLDGSLYDGVALTLGSAGTSASLNLLGAFLEHRFTINAAGSATVAAVGPSAIAGTVTDVVSGTTLRLRGGYDCLPGDLIISHGADVSVGSGVALDLAGHIRAEAELTAAAGSTVDNDAQVSVAGTAVDLAGSVAGCGTFVLDEGSTLEVGGRVGAGQTIAFGDVNAKLQIAQISEFDGAVRGFHVGDQINFTGVRATNATYDAATQTLSLTDAAGATIATLRNVQAAAGGLVAFADAQGTGTTVGYADALAPEKYGIATADRAMRANVVRSSMTVPGTDTPITGAGVKVGIISDSFDDFGTANADAAAGYLPANPDGTSAVHVVRSAAGGLDDEGREMAEEIHQVAPGASIDFAAAGASETTFEQAVADLVKDGCKIIVSDKNYTYAPFYQVTGGLDASVTSAIAQGVNFFDSAGNYGQSDLETKFAPQWAILPDGTRANAQIFSDGTDEERITIPAATSSRIDLQWTAPYEGSDNKGAPDALTLKVFRPDGTLVDTASGSPTATVVDEDGVPTTDLAFVLPTAVTATDYDVVVYQNGTAAQPAAFKMILSINDGKGTGSGGTFDDPQAGQGSGDERGVQLIPGVNSVGAVDWSNSAALGGTPHYDEYFSSEGPGLIYYDKAGDPLSHPEVAGKVDFTAPDGVTVPDPASSDPNVTTPFFGTSAAAPNAAATAALMLQADPNLTTGQVTSLLGRSAINQGLSAAQQGAGFIQADRAVSLAIQASGYDSTRSLGTGASGSDLLHGLGHLLS